MDMWMVQDVLTPRMQHAHETDLSTQVLGIGSDLKSVAALARNSRS